MYNWAQSILMGLLLSIASLYGQPAQIIILWGLTYDHVALTGSHTPLSTMVTLCHQNYEECPQCWITPIFFSFAVHLGVVGLVLIVSNSLDLKFGVFPN